MAATGIAVATVGAGPGAAPSGALPTTHDSDCIDPELNFTFWQGEWTDTQSAAFYEGAGAWHQVVDDDGDPFVDVTGTGGTEIIVYRRDLPGSRLGEFSCNDGTIVIDTSLTTVADIAATAAHEVGHAIGLEHTGDGDNLYDLSAPDPVMTTCPLSSDHEPGQDDFAQLAHLYSGSTRRNTADASFEAEHLEWWRGQNLQFELSTAFASSGENSVFVEATAGDPLPRLHQSVRNIEPDDQYHVAVTYKGGADTTGRIGLRLAVREVRYDAATPSQAENCQWPNDWDINSPMIPNPYRFAYDEITWATIDDTWKALDIPAWTPPIWEGIDVQVNVYKDTSTGVWIDRPRVLSSTPGGGT